MLPLTQPYERHLEQELFLRSVTGEADAERVAAFNGIIHGKGVAGMTRELLLCHPSTSPDQWLYVQDDSTHRVVSALCLIPWTLDMEGVELLAGEVGIVGTDPGYRHRGLVRAQFERHHELLCAGNHDLGIIQGIPYFYRQFGYQYALPLEGGWHLELRCMPESHSNTSSLWAFRLATTDDVPALCLLYDESAKHLDISARRTPAIWRYLLGPSRDTEMTAETWLVIDGSGGAVGYVRIPAHGFVDGLIVNEASHCSADLARAMLVQVKAWAVERQKPFVRLTLPDSHPLIATARQFEAAYQGHYAWQIHVVDVGRLLKKLAPVFAKRLANTPFANLTADLILNCYREAWQLCFQNGTLADVRSLGFHEGGDIRLPPFLAAPLLLGHHTWRQLRPFYPDLGISAQWEHLTDILFPQTRAFIYTIY